MQRIIAHIDMNSFYASVEQKYNPSFKNKPVAIAGSVKDRHGIIVTSSYEARKFGVKTTMRVGDAKKLCPSLIILKPNFELYQDESKKIFDLVKEYTECVEIVSIDEAYIDLTDVENPIKTIAVIQRRIYLELNLPSSVGVSYNKFFAKMASDMKKPLGFTIINKKNFKKLLWDMPLHKMHGCGDATSKKLNKYGMTTIKDLAQADKLYINSILGTPGLRLQNRANGFDERKLKYTVDRKSIGNSKTFSTDLDDEDEIFKEIKKLAKKVATRARAKNYLGINISIVIKFNDFKQITRAKKIEDYTNDTDVIFTHAWELILANYDFQKPIRLLGVSLNDVKKKNKIATQLNIFMKKQEKTKLEKIVDELNRKYGRKVVFNVEDEKKEKVIITTSFSKDFSD